MKRVVTFGEIMLRLSPNGCRRFFQNDQMQATFGGAEANVAVSLANFGVQSTFVTKLPNNAVADAAAAELRRFGVDTSHIVRGGDRVGIYYLENGAGERGSICIYDRKHSSISEADLNDFHWDSIFENADWFHFTGITPALGENTAELCRIACAEAKKKHVRISCDLNYRSKLWTKEQANRVMTELCQYIDVCIANEEDAKDVFGITAPNSDINTGKLDMDGYKYVAEQLQKRFDFDKVAITLRKSFSASDNDWSGLLYDGKAHYVSREHHIHIVDRVGGGDSFGAALIYAELNGKTPQEAIDFAAAASSLKQTIEGDFNRISVSEAEALANGDRSGRVKR